MLPTKIAFVDLETTGARAQYDRIIEIGIIIVQDNKIIDTFQTLINPESYLPQEIIRITGIKPKDLEDAPLFSSVAEKVYELLKGCTFVAHNVRFDYGFLRFEFKRQNISFNARHFCTVKLSRELFPKYLHHNLDSIIERFGFTCVNRHRALDDAKILFEFYQKLQQVIPSERFIKAVKNALKRPTLPPNLRHIDIEKLPESPGVYLFYGENGTPLYIGKSKNMRNRVLSHFSGDIRYGIEMKIAQQIKSLETIPTGGELSALFLESQLIKKHLPLYNRRLRRTSLLIVLKLTTDKNGYATIALNTLTEEDIALLYQSIRTTKDEIYKENNEETLGFFRSQRQAKDYLLMIAKEYNLCEKLLGLEKTNSACFGYRLERCKGACINKENPLFYNLRMTAAISSIRIKPWPFPGPIVIEERNDFYGLSDQLLIDKWCHLGTIRHDKEGNKSFVEKYKAFDVDAYKILKQYLFSPKNTPTIHPLRNDELKSFSEYIHPETSTN